MVIGVTGALFAPTFLSLMHAPPGVLANVAYTRIMLGFSAVIIMLFLLNAIFRGAGDAAIALRVLWLANAINIVLDPCFIFGLGPFPRLGVVGAATATTIGRGIGVLFALSRLARSTERIPIRRVRLTPELGSRDPEAAFAAAAARVMIRFPDRWRAETCDNVRAAAERGFQTGAMQRGAYPYYDAAPRAGYWGSASTFGGGWKTHRDTGWKPVRSAASWTSTETAP